EAFLKLGGESFTSRSHFLRTTAVAMRNILVDHARSKGRMKRGGRRGRVELADIPARGDADPALLLSQDDALARLTAEDPPAAEVASLHLFAGLPADAAADALGVSRATAYRHRNYARAWLQAALGENP
ncbi:MAG: ECF-type sigma factor, partial [Gemmataceae bacterium]